MSDLFSNTSNKGRIFDLYKVDQQVNISAEALLLPSEPPQPEKSVSSHQAVNFVIANGITAFAPHYISELQKQPITITNSKTLEIFNEQLRELQIAAIRNESPTDMYRVVPDMDIFVPIGPPRVMSYSPKYYNKPFDKAVLNQITYYWLSVDGYQHFGGTVRELSDVAKNTVLSTGTWQGQLERLSSMRSIRDGKDGFFKPRTLMQCDISIEEFAVALEETMPITFAQYEDKTRPKPKALQYLPVNYIEIVGDHIIDHLPAVRLKSTAGPPYPSGYKKGATVTSTVFMLTVFFQELAEVLLKNNEEDTKKGMRALLDKFYYMACAYCFPKEERYDRDKLKTKTRNIMSMSYLTHLALSMVLEPVTQKTLNVLNCKTTRLPCVRGKIRLKHLQSRRPSPSLSKFSPWHGGMNEFLNKVISMMNDGDLFIDFVYADNWYVLYRNDDDSYDYYSLDLTKSEANATPDLAQAVSYYLLTRGWSTRQYLGFGPTWAYFMMNIAPALIVDNVLIFTNLQLQVPGQASGNTLTYQINTAVTTKARIAYYKYATDFVASRVKTMDGELDRTVAGKAFPRPDTNEFIKIMESVGVNIKTELVIEQWDKKLMELQTNTPAKGPLQDEEFEDIDTYIYEGPPILECDLLGYDVAYSNLLGGYVPVLAKQRLFASISYPKKTVEDLKDPLQYRAFRILRYETLRIMGAWAYPVINAGIRQVSSSIRESLIQSGKEVIITKDRAGEIDDLASSILEETSLQTIDVSTFGFTQPFMETLNTTIKIITDETGSVAKGDMLVGSMLNEAKQNKRMLNIDYPHTPYNKLRAYMPIASIMQGPLNDLTRRFSENKLNESSVVNKELTPEQKTMVDTNIKLLTRANKELTKHLDYAIETLHHLKHTKIVTPSMIVTKDVEIANPTISSKFKPAKAQNKFIAGMTRSQKKNSKKKDRHARQVMELKDLKTISDMDMGVIITPAKLHTTAQEVNFINNGASTSTSAFIK